MLAFWARRSTSNFLESSFSVISEMFYRTLSIQQQTVSRQSTWSKLGSQLLAARPSSAQHHLLTPTAPAQWHAANRKAAVLGLMRGGTLVAMGCLADEALAASFTTEDSATPAYSFGANTTVVTSSSYTSSEGVREGVPNSHPSLVLSSGACLLPHPDKVQKGGEDSFFIASNRRAVGVADGVGGWAEVGVDAGAYARQLMSHASDAADSVSEEAAQQPELSAQSILEKAYPLTSVRGSSTACVAVLNGDSLRVSNLGDSGLLVMRGGAVAFHTPQQQHAFNFPYQIGSADSMSDLPTSAQRFEVTVQPGDIIVLGTDGLWDNCFDEEIVNVLSYCGKQRLGVNDMAKVLTHYARHRAADSKFASPFAYSAFQAGFAYMGGKMDDITVVVCVVQYPSTL